MYERENLVLALKENIDLWCLKQGVKKVVSVNSTMEKISYEKCWKRVLLHEWVYVLQ
jgi:hypothetical protein